MKKILYIVVGIIFIVIGGLLFYVVKNGNLFNYNDFIYIGVFDSSLNKGDSYIFTSYDDYINTLNMRVLSEEDFVNNNYVLVGIHYDPCSNKDIKLSNYEINGNNIEVNVTYNEACKICGPVYSYYLLKVDKTMTEVNVNINYNSLNKVDCDTN